MPIEKKKISYTVDLTEELDKRNVKPHKRKEAARVAGEEAVKNILQYTESQRSSVTGDKWEDLTSEQYINLKKKMGKGSKANLKLHGDMLSSLKVESNRKSFTIKITDSDEKKKAHNHNTDKDSISTSPKRQFLPNDENGESFHDPIETKYKKKLDKYKEEPVEAKEVKEVKEEAPPVSGEILWSSLLGKKAVKKEPVIEKSVADLLAEWDVLRKNLLEEKGS